MTWWLVLAAADPSPLAQVDDLQDWIVILGTILFFIVFLNLMRTLVFNPVFALLEERRQRIAAGLESADAQREQVAQLQAEYDRRWAAVEAAAQERTQSAIDGGKKVVQALQEQARLEYLRRLEEGQRKLQEEIAASREPLLADATRLTLATVRKTLPSSAVDEGAWSARIRQRLEEVMPQ